MEKITLFLEKHSWLNFIVTIILLWTFLFSIHTTIVWIETKWLESRTADYWKTISVLTVTSPEVKENALPQMYILSENIRPHDAFWKLRMYCDTNHDSIFEYINKLETNVPKEQPRIIETPFPYGGPYYKNPPVGSVCEIRTEVVIKPPHIDTEFFISTTSNRFTIIYE